jgi:hypothetical protein
MRLWVHDDARHTEIPVPFPRPSHISRTCPERATFFPALLLYLSKSNSTCRILFNAQDSVHRTKSY